MELKRDGAVREHLDSRVLKVPDHGGLRPSDRDSRVRRTARSAPPQWRAGGQGDGLSGIDTDEVSAEEQKIRFEAGEPR